MDSELNLRSHIADRCAGLQHTRQPATPCDPEVIAVTSLHHCNYFRSESSLLFALTEDGQVFLPTSADSLGMVGTQPGALEEVCSFASTNFTE